MSEEKDRLRVLVTGGAGFIGGNFVNSFFGDSKFDMTVVDDLSNSQLPLLRKDVINNDKLVISDFSSDIVLSRVKNGEFDVIVHFAAMPRVSFSVENPVDSHNTNVTKTLSLIDAARLGNVQRFVFASSSAVYGNKASKEASTEKDETNPNSPYALQKLQIEEYLQLYHKLYNFDYVALRFFNVYGEGQIGGSAYSTAISNWLTSAFKGDQLRFDGDGLQTRDLIHVQDVVNAVYHVLTEKDLSNRVFNVCTNTSISNQELFDIINTYVHVTKREAPERPGDVKHTLGSNELLQWETYWQPKIDIHVGVYKTYQWFNANWDLISKLKVGV
jgi:UDP-glucose 4-epimerase